MKAFSMTRKSKIDRRSATDYPPLCWNFGDHSLLPDKQTEAAYYWEFALESTQIIQEVKRIRKKIEKADQGGSDAFFRWAKQNPPPSDVDKISEWSKRARAAVPDYDLSFSLFDYNTHFLIYWPEFPCEHWLEISPTVRSDEKRLRPIRDLPGNPSKNVWNPDYWMKRNEMKEFETVPSFYQRTAHGLACHTWVTQFNMTSGLDLFKNWHDSVKTPFGYMSPDRWDELRLIRVNWARSDRKLKADFAAWLKANRPDDRKAFHATKGSDSRRTNHRDLLKFLGADRLLRHFKGDWLKAADFSASYCKDKKGQPKSLYVEQSEWADAQQKAKQALREFHSKVLG
jgi:hypothetical protein